MNPPDPPHPDHSSGAAPDGGPRNRRTEPATETLFLEVRSLRNQVSDLGGRVDGLTSSTHAFINDVAEGLAPDVAELRHDVNELTNQVRRVLRRHFAETPTAVNWPALPAPQAAQQWRRLARWVDEVLVGWYRVTREELPDCWALHRPAVLELSWLRTTYLQSHHHDGGPHAIADWHLRWRSGVLARLQEVIPKKWCRAIDDDSGWEHLVSEEESRARADTRMADPAWQAALERRAAARSNGQTGPFARADQLAEPRFWLPYQQQAAEEDLRWRRAHAIGAPTPEPTTEPATEPAR